MAPELTVAVDDKLTFTPCAKCHRTFRSGEHYEFASSGAAQHVPACPVDDNRSDDARRRSGQDGRRVADTVARSTDTALETPATKSGTDRTGEVGKTGQETNLREERSHMQDVDTQAARIGAVQATGKPTAPQAPSSPTTGSGQKPGTTNPPPSNNPKK